MAFASGDKVRVNESTSRYHGCTGIVYRTQVRGLAILYEVSFEKTQPGILYPENKFFEYELEPLS